MEEEINVLIEDPSIPKCTLRPIMYVSWLLGVGVARLFKMDHCHLSNDSLQRLLNDRPI